MLRVSQFALPFGETELLLTSLTDYREPSYIVRNIYAWYKLR
jgi:hypothetical protein